MDTSRANTVHLVRRTSLWQGCAATIAFALVVGGCQPEDPYEGTAELPTSKEEQAATAAVEPGMGAARDGSVPGATAQLPLDQRAAAEQTEWSGATQADYDKAIADCEQMGEAMRAECVEQVRLGFRAAQQDAQNPAEAQSNPVPRDQPTASEDAAAVTDTGDDG